jgi:ribosomal protein S27E
MKYGGTGNKRTSIMKVYKKKRLDAPSEVVFPELKKPGRYAQKEIKLECPDCELNDTFQIIETVFKPKSVPGVGSRSGRYRAKCTACGYITVITSKTPL